MSSFTPPASQAAVTPPTPAAGVQIVSTDQIHYDAIFGQTIYGGLLFTDTLGGFYPITIKPSGGLTINGSTANPGSIVFHHTTTAVTDGLLSFTVGTTPTRGGLWFGPNSALSSATYLAVADRTGATFKGWTLEALISTFPTLYVLETAGVLTKLYQNGIHFSNSADGGFEADSADGTTSVMMEAGNGFDPTISVFGSNAAINLFLKPKGGGQLGYVKATVALGGGAGATLGTIGGSGPTAAGQAVWIPIKSGATGTTQYWVPAWT